LLPSVFGAGGFGIGGRIGIRRFGIGDFGDGFGKFGVLGGDLDDELFDFCLALLLELGEFLLLPLQFLELELELAQVGYCQRKATPTALSRSCLSVPSSCSRITRDALVVAIESTITSI
jgi:hypothetical protein